MISQGKDVFLVHHSLSAIELKKIDVILGRKATLLEIELYSAIWSEHCSYSQTKEFLNELNQIRNSILNEDSVEGQNAGLIRINDGYSFCFKIESHNHPSFIEPMNGSATGVGGILRDVVAMGAEPCALSFLLRLPENPLKKSIYIEKILKGLSFYGNCYGCATVFSSIDYDDSYNSNLLVNALASGFVKTSEVLNHHFKLSDCVILYVGNQTGMDGIHGASMASQNFEIDDDSKEHNIQVGDPFIGRKTLDAIKECRKYSLIEAMQDLGAAGLTSALTEIASANNVGVDIWLDNLPVRIKTMGAIERMLSESQERMIIIAKKDNEEKINSIFEKWNLECVEIATINTHERFRVFYNEQICADLKLTDFSQKPPKAEINNYLTNGKAELGNSFKKSQHPNNESLESKLYRCLQLKLYKNQSKDLKQFDQSIGHATIYSQSFIPAALLRVPDKFLFENKAQKYGLCIVARDDICANFPFEGTVKSVQNAVLRLACIGVNALAISDCINHGDPENIEQRYALKEVFSGLSKASKELNIPVISGNVSLYNATLGRSIPPTPSIAVFGLQKERKIGVSEDFEYSGSKQLFLIGNIASSIKGSYFENKELLQQLDGNQRYCFNDKFPAIWGIKEFENFKNAILQIFSYGYAEWMWPSSAGGLLLSILKYYRYLEGTNQGNGSQLSLTLEDLSAATLLGENTMFSLVSVDAMNCRKLEKLLNCHKIPFREISKHSVINRSNNLSTTMSGILLKSEKPLLQANIFINNRMAMEY